jgi:hypothetical protein
MSNRATHNNTTYLSGELLVLKVGNLLLQLVPLLDQLDLLRVENGLLLCNIRELRDEVVLLPLRFLSFQ